MKLVLQPLSLLLSLLLSLWLSLPTQAQTTGQNSLEKKAATGSTKESFTLGTSQIIGRTAAGVVSGFTLGTGLSLSGSTLNATASSAWGDLTGVPSAITTLSSATAAGLALMDDANAAAQRTTLGLAIGTNVQAFDSDLTTWAGVTPGAGIATFLTTPSSANLRATVTDETGSGSLVFATSPTLTTPVAEYYNGLSGADGSSGGYLRLTGGSGGAGTSGAGGIDLRGGSFSGVQGCFITANGGSATGTSAGSIYTHGGVAAGASGGIIYTYGQTLPGGAINTSDGGGSIDTRGTGSIQFGSTGTRTTLNGAASSNWTLTLPTGPGSDGQVLQTNGSGTTSWATVSSGLTIGTTAITGGTSGRVLMSGATVSEQATTGTGDIVMASSPTLVTPALGTPSSVNLTNATALPASGVVGTAITEAGSAAHDRILCANQQYQYSWTGSSLATTGTGSSNSFGYCRDIFTGATASSTSRISMFPGVPYNGLEQGNQTGGRFLPWNKRVTVSFSIVSQSTSTNGTMWFRLGETNASTDMAARGIGVKVTNKTVILEVHNGTTRATSATIATISGDYLQQHFLLQSDGSGNVSVWLNGAFVLTLAGGPTTAGANVTTIVAAVANNADASQNQWTFMPVLVRVAP